MPKIMELKEIDGALWARIGAPGDFPSGVALWTPDDQDREMNGILEVAARAADQVTSGPVGRAVRALKVIV